MKAHTGLFELVMIMVFIIAGTPLLLSLIISTNRSKFNYLDDKTVYSMGSVVDYVYSDATHSYLPVNLAPIRLDYGGAQLIALIQDDYCPETGKLVNWKLTATSPDGTAAGVPVTPITWGSNTHTLIIGRGWLTKRANYFSSLHNRTSGAMKSIGVDQPFYLVWDYESDCWMITHEFVNIFEEK